MKHSRTAAALAAALMLAAPAVAAAAAAQADVLREAQDRAEIEALMWRYDRALDGWNPDAYAAVFTPDGAFGKTKGRESLRKMVADLKAGNDARAAKGEPALGPMHHIITNQHLEFVSRDHARFHYYWMTVFGGADLKDPPKVAAAGNGVDDVVRVGGQWLIQMRDVSGAGD